MKYLVKFGYDGTKFTGYQRGNGTNSVEDAIISALSSYGLSDDMQSAARTDRKVSAAGNVFSLYSSEKPDKITGILNSEIENMFFHSYAEVDDKFNARHNRMKHYRYTLCGNEKFLEDVSGILFKFQGRHDFSLFSRKDSRNPVRTIDRIDCSTSGNMLQIDIFGKSFIWNQLRGIIGFSKYYAERNLEIDDPFASTRKFPFLADPEPLVLMDIEYDGIAFKKKYKAGKLKALKKKIRKIETERRNLEALISME